MTVGEQSGSEAYKWEYAAFDEFEGGAKTRFSGLINTKRKRLGT